MKAMKTQSITLAWALCLGLVPEICPAQAFRYDASGRLIEARYTATNSLIYAYDAAGNLITNAVSKALPDQDSDHDGMPDAWELVYFNTLTNTAGGDFNRDGRNNLAEYQNGSDPANPDSDGDGLPNTSELLAGTNPLDPNSRLSIGDSGWNAARDGFVLRWQSVGGKRYRLEQSGDLLASPFAPLWTNILATPPQNTVTDFNAVIGFGRFYRVRLE